MRHGIESGLGHERIELEDALIAETIMPLRFSAFIAEAMVTGQLRLVCTLSAPTQVIRQCSDSIE